MIGTRVKLSVGGVLSTTGNLVMTSSSRQQLSKILVKETKSLQSLTGNFTQTKGEQKAVEGPWEGRRKAQIISNEQRGLRELPSGKRRWFRQAACPSRHVKISLLTFRWRHACCYGMDPWATGMVKVCGPLVRGLVGRERHKVLAFLARRNEVAVLIWPLNQFF